MEPLHASTVAAMTYLALLIPAPPAAPPAPDAATSSTSTGGVVVNEFSPDGLFGDEFVELRNTGTQAVDVSGWDLLVCVSPTTAELAITFPGGAVISAGEHILLTHPDWASGFGPPPDYHYDVDVPEDGGWLLHDFFSGYADGVGLGSGLFCTEGDPAPQCDWHAGEAATRDQDGTDTDDNSVDFTCQTRTPGW